MARCQLHYQQPMPPVCLCCGREASHLSRQTFINTNPWTLWTVPLGTWYYNKIVLHIPLCDAHRNTIRYRWAGPFTFLVVSGLLIFASWGVFSSLFGREASDSVSGIVGGAVAAVVAVFYISLLYFSFTRPHVSRVEGDFVTLSNVSDEFAAAAHGRAASGAIMTAELVEDSLGKPPGPVQAAQFAAPSRTGATRGLPWGWIVAGGAALFFLFTCGAGMGLVIGVNLAREVRISAEATRGPMLMNGSTILRVTYEATGDLDDRDQFAWVVRHGAQTLRPRFISAFELRRGGVVEFHVFDPTATSAEIWLERISMNGQSKMVSNVARVRTGGA